MTRSAWKLGKIAGINIYLHWTFLLLPAFIGLSTWMSAGGMAALSSVVFIAAVFGCVLLHELGHALAARRYGIGTHDITLLPIGGLARLHRMPSNPWQELVIALAGPAVNAVIAGSLLGGYALAGGHVGAMLTDPFVLPLIGQLVWANVALVLFNLLPAFPMDGGRVLRSVLAMQMPRLKATEIAATVGQVLAVALGLLGLFSLHIGLMLVGLFVFFAARAELASVRREESLKQAPWQPAGYGADPSYGPGAGHPPVQIIFGEVRSGPGREFVVRGR